MAGLEYFVDLSGLELVILMLLSSECFHCRHVPPYFAESIIFHTFNLSVNVYGTGDQIQGLAYAKEALNH